MIKYLNKFYVLTFFLLITFIFVKPNLLYSQRKAFNSQPHNATVSLVITKGESVEVNPYSDMNGGSTVGQYGYNNTYDTSALTIEPIKAYVGIGHEYWKYKITGIKTGAYTFSCWMFFGSAASNVAVADKKNTSYIFVIQIVIHFQFLLVYIVVYIY